MDKWTISSNGPNFDYAELINYLKNLRSSNDDYANDFRCLFYRIVKDFLGGSKFRPIPPKLAKGRCIDLFKLFCVVKEKGGYDTVSRNGLWVFVVEELGLEVTTRACVKLVYNKYLCEFDRFLNEFLRGGREYEEKDNWLVELELNGNGKCTTSFAGSNAYLRHSSNVYKACDGEWKPFNDDDENLELSNEIVDSRKRKRESLGGILNWVIDIAKHPCGDPAVQTEYRSKELWAQAVILREARLLPKHIASSGDQSLSQRKTKIHPSIYEDKNITGNHTTGSLRCSKRIHSLKKSCPCCKLDTTSPSNSGCPPKRDLENLAHCCKPVFENSACHCKSVSVFTGLNELELKNTKAYCKSYFKTTGSPCKPYRIPKQETVLLVDSATSCTKAGSVVDAPTTQVVRVGSQFQAEVPSWTGTVYKSDPKWLGRRVWPLDAVRCSRQNEVKLIGKGRPNLCNCRFPGSVNCVRFHIAEKRMKLKLELGVAFYQWRVVDMGEEISLGWTGEEEKRFMQMVRSNPPSLGRCFWDFASKYFPRKKREDLVRYYFNVFVIRRRSYQNRVTPKSIDSDDDESEFGSFSDSFGQEAVSVSGTNWLTCSENTECTEVEQSKYMIL